MVGSATGHVSKLNCKQCKTGFIWKSLTGNNLCLNSEVLGTANLKSKCIRYKKVADDYLCE